MNCAFPVSGRGITRGISRSGASMPHASELSTASTRRSSRRRARGPHPVGARLARSIRGATAGPTSSYSCSRRTPTSSCMLWGCLRIWATGRSTSTWDVPRERSSQGKGLRLLARPRGDRCVRLRFCAHPRLVALAPGEHGIQHGPHALAERRERVLHARRHLGVDGAADEAVCLHLA